MNDLMLGLMRLRLALKTLAAADSYEGVTVAGIAVLAADTGRVLMTQRAYDETDDPEVQESWEFPGGHLNEGEEPFAGAMREFEEETAFFFTEGEGVVVNGWRSEDGHYQGFVVLVPTEFDVRSFEPTEEVQAVRWMDVASLSTDEWNIRPEVLNTDFSVFDLSEVSGNDDEVNDDLDDDLDEWALDVPVIPIHGTVAPESVLSGDGRGFMGDAMSSRPLPLPFQWQKVSQPGHDNSIVIGSVDRLARKDGEIIWEGRLLASPEASEFLELLEHFGRFGISVDGDNAELSTHGESLGQTWYDRVRHSGVTAVAIPAFHQAYVAFGPHPDMGETLSPDETVLVASSFKRGAGWVTNPEETNRLHKYWTQKGQPGYAKIKWGTPGDWRRAKALIGEKIAKNSPEKMKYLNQIISQWHFDALGYWPGELGKPGNAPDTKENRRRAATHAATQHLLVDASVEGGYLAISDELFNAYYLAGRIKQVGVRDDGVIIYEMDKVSPDDIVLTAAVGVTALPPVSYFERHPDTGALVIEDPDEFGIQRTYGYAAEWGVCHLGAAQFGECVTTPQDNGRGFPDFHQGYTRTKEGKIATGLITYGVGHREAEQILAETPTKAHHDDISNAWAAVRLGEDERGIWFSGVVLPTVDAKWITTIEASGQVSGEWLGDELRTLLTVNVPAFPVQRSSVTYKEDGSVAFLAASAFSWTFQVAEPIPGAQCAHQGCEGPATHGVWLTPNEPTIFCLDHSAEAESTFSCEATSRREEMLALIEGYTAVRFQKLMDEFYKVGE